MAVGSYAAGSTLMGGGTVGFPVLVLLFDLVEWLSAVGAKLVDERRENLKTGLSLWRYWRGSETN